MSDTNFSLDQKLQQQQQQVLSPQQIQMMKMLELPVMQLEQRIEREIEDNPMLEEVAMDDKDGNDNDINIDELAHREVTAKINYSVSNNDHTKSKDPTEFIPSVGESLRDYVLDQLRYRDISPEMRDIVYYLVDSIDDDGYIRHDEQTLADDMIFIYGVEISVDKIKAGIHIIQSLEPAGVGARDLKECLLLQLDRQPNRDKVYTLTRRILSSYYDDFLNKRFDKLGSVLGITEGDLRDVVDEVRKFTPKPGSMYGGWTNEITPYILPDFIVENNNGTLTVRLNIYNSKKVQISSNYAEEVSKLSEQSSVNQKQQSEAQGFVNSKLNAAKWFVNALKHRELTLIKTMQAIVLYQRKYFIEGTEASLRPMILRDISDLTGFDESTISRVVNRKYVQTDFGVFLLRTIFSHSVVNIKGDEVSSLEVRKVLRDIIDAEDKRAPLVDDELMKVLRDAGYDMARRTIAKYRESMGIPKAKLRKEL